MVLGGRRKKRRRRDDDERRTLSQPAAQMTPTGHLLLGCVCSLFSIFGVGRQHRSIPLSLFLGRNPRGTYNGAKSKKREKEIKCPPALPSCPSTIYVSPL